MYIYMYLSPKLGIPMCEENGKNEATWSPKQEPLKVFDRGLLGYIPPLASHVPMEPCLGAKIGKGKDRHRLQGL